MAGADALTIHTDGGARGNPGPAAYAYVIERDGHPPIEEADCLGETTNNQAEYTALVEALEHALTLGTQYHVIVHSDSELMVKQLNGEYKVKNEDLRPLYEEALRLKRLFPKGVVFRHVRRAQNQRADALCNEAMDGKRTRSICTPPPATRNDAAGPAVPEARKRPAELSASARPAQPDLHEEAVACLREAGVASPELVWQRLTDLLRKHLTP